MELYKATETHFGDDYANAQIKAKFYKALLHGIVTGALLGVSIFLATFNMDYEVAKFSQVVAPVISGIVCNCRIISPRSML
jgi:formate/nitrite transporter FocA (FNT family)